MRTPYCIMIITSIVLTATSIVSAGQVGFDDSLLPLGSANGAAPPPLAESYFLSEACQQADFDGDGVVDQVDFGYFQLCYSGEDPQKRVINVKEYGAVGDGVTDDTAALDACWAYASTISNGKSIYIPAGTYLYSGSGLYMRGRPGDIIRFVNITDGAVNTATLTLQLSGSDRFNYQTGFTSLVLNPGESVTLEAAITGVWLCDKTQ